MKDRSDIAESYYGVRLESGCAVFRVVGGRDQPLPLRLEIFNHSPDGFEWGYGGSGPSQLALALVYDIVRRARPAVMMHQQFKWRCVAHLPHDAWSLTRSEVIEHVRAIHPKKPK